MSRPDIFPDGRDVVDPRSREGQKYVDISRNISAIVDWIDLSGSLLRNSLYIISFLRRRLVIDASYRNYEILTASYTLRHVALPTVFPLII